MKFIFAILIYSAVALSVQAQQQMDNMEIKSEMIDSARDARMEMYVNTCLPEFNIRIRQKKDSFDICSVEMIFYIAPDIDDEQYPVLEKFMTDVAHYYNKKGIHIMFEYGIINGSVDYLYEKMFNNKKIYVPSGEKNTTRSRVTDLIGLFNKITESYAGR